MSNVNVIDPVGTPSAPATAHSIPATTGELTIVMPCLNESETLAICIRKARAALEQNGITGEVLIADNGSTDGSQAIAEMEGARVVNVPVRGYGAALLAGIEASTTTYVLMGDADDSYDFSHAPRFLERLRGGAELVMGNRFKGGIAPGAMPFLHRYLGNPVLSLAGKLLFQVPCSDFHCGLRAFNREVIHNLNLRTLGMEFASEMVVKAGLYKLRIEEVPTTLKPDGRSRAPHLRTWRDGWRHLRFLLMYSSKVLFLYPGLLLMLVCGLAASMLIGGPITLGHVSFDVDTLVYAVLGFMLGFQAVAFFVGAKTFAVAEGLIPGWAFPRKAFKLFNLEIGLVFGSLMLLAGVLGTIFAIVRWKSTNFGKLDPTAFLRLTLPSACAIALGMEIVFLSFFLSILFIKRK